MKGKWKVLLIDDELEFHQLFRAAFPEVELISTYTMNGARWLIANATVPFDLILLDLNLHGGENTFESLKQISRLSFSPIIVLSTYADHNARFEVQRRGAADFLSKGNFDLNAWLGILKRVLAKAVDRQARVSILFHSKDRSFVRYLSDKLVEHQFNVQLGESDASLKPYLFPKSEFHRPRSVLCAISPEALSDDRWQKDMAQALELERQNKKPLLLPLIVRSSDLPESLMNRQSVHFPDNNTFPTAFRTLLDLLKTQHKAD